MRDKRVKISQSVSQPASERSCSRGKNEQSKSHATLHHILCSTVLLHASHTAQKLICDKMLQWRTSSNRNNIKLDDTLIQSIFKHLTFLIYSITRNYYAWFRDFKLTLCCSHAINFLCGINAYCDYQIIKSTHDNDISMFWRLGMGTKKGALFTYSF